MKNRLITLSAAGLAIAIALAIFGSGVDPAQPGSATTTAAPAKTAESAAKSFPAGPIDFRFGWEAGSRYTYALDYDGNTMVTPFGPAGDGAVRGVMDLEADFVLSVHRADEERAIIGLSLADFRQHRMEIMDQSVLPDGESLSAHLLGQEALLDITRLGKVERILFDPDTPALFRNIAQLLVGDTQVVVSSLRGKQWSNIENTQYGTGPADYAVAAIKPQIIELVKTRNRYDHLAALQASSRDAGALVEAEHTIELDRAGCVASIAGTETIRANDAGQTRLDSRTQISLELTDVSAFQPATNLTTRLAAADEMRMGEVALTDAAERRGLEQRTGGMTMDQVINDVLLFANAGAVPHHNKWLWQATGVLMLYPERSAELIAVFQDAHLNEKSRGLILDLLANVGHPHAQDALRRILETPTARQDRLYPLYLQRFVLVDEPDLKSLEFVSAEYSSHEGPNKRAAAHALGSLAGGLAANGQPAEANRFVGQMVDDLRTSEDPQEKEALIKGLGNAAMESNIDILDEFSDAEDDRVRASVATALRHTQTEKSEGMAMDLAVDTSANVQAMALHTLESYKLNAGHLQEIDALIQEDLFNPDAYGAVLDVAAANRKQRDEYGKMLHSMLDNGVEDRKMRIRIREMLKY